MADAQDRGWGPGWPACQQDKIVPHSLYVGGLRRELVELVDRLTAETARRGYRFVEGWCWGFACRPIKRADGSLTDVPSNHSWGLAVDINAPLNPKTDGPLVTDMPDWMPRLWESYGFGWGGRYVGSKDAMHYEFLGTPEDAAAETRRARLRLPTQEEDMFHDFKEGWKAHAAGQALRDDWPEDKKFGWRARFQATRVPPHDHAATPSPDHTHPHTHTASTVVEESG